MMPPTSRVLFAAGAAALVLVNTGFGTNPLILDQFTADPSARVFEGRLYVYPSHDIRAAPGQGKPGWFCMEDYHVFSSENLTDWKDHGVIVRQTEVPWVDAHSYSMWAPDCAYRDGKYFFYFPAQIGPKAFRVGVAVSDKPDGPFQPEPKPIEGVEGIDPCVFIDRDGAAYLYYSSRKILVAKLKENMRELDGAPQVLANLPTKGLIEGPFVFERNGIYYLTYPHVEHQTERLEYAVGNHPLGPFKPAGVIMDELPSGCWTNHHSIVQYQGQWYLFYHDNQLSPDFDKNRSIRADRLFFNDDGTIQKVTPTLRGVGVISAKRRLQIDRYSETSAEGVKVAFLDAENPQEGWKVVLRGDASWVRFNEVDFGSGDGRVLEVRATAPKGGTLELRVDRPDGPVLSRVEIAKASDWVTVRAPVTNAPAGVHDLIVTRAGARTVEIDWLRFE